MFSKIDILKTKINSPMQEIFVLTTKFISISLVIVNMNCVNYAYTQSDNNSFIGEELSTLAEDLQTGAYFAKLGFQYSKQGDYGAAQRSFQTAIRLQPNLTVAHAGLGFVFLQQNIFKEAIAAYQKAIQINPDFIQIYKDLGLAYTKYEQYDEAIQTYKRAIQLFPKSADLHRTLGSTYMILGGFHKAKLAYRKSLELEPNVAAVHDNLGTIYKNDGSLDLYITNYADYDLERDRRCEIGGVWVYCGPRSYPPDVDVCYRNNGNGTFTDFSQQSGILNVAAKNQ